KMRRLLRSNCDQIRTNFQLRGTGFVTEALMKSALSFLALCILTTTSFAQTHPAVTALPNSVYVGADGKFESAPDTAEIRFNISAQDDTSQKAYARASKQA